MVAYVICDIRTGSRGTGTCGTDDATRRNKYRYKDGRGKRETKEKLDKTQEMREKLATHTEGDGNMNSNMCSRICLIQHRPRDLMTPFTIYVLLSSTAVPIVIPAAVATPPPVNNSIRDKQNK